jgi:hypothetical protein
LVWVAAGSREQMDTFHVEVRSVFETYSYS